MSIHTYIIDTKYACGALVVSKNKVRRTAPIFRWMRGKKWSEVKAWLKLKEYT